MKRAGNWIIAVVAAATMACDSTEVTPPSPWPARASA